MDSFQEKTADMREVSAFWMRIVRSEEEKTADRIRASELWAKTAAREAQPDEGGLSEADRALLRKVAQRFDILSAEECGGNG